MNKTNNVVKKATSRYMYTIILNRQQMIKIMFKIFRTLQIRKKNGAHP